MKSVRIVILSSRGGFSRLLSSTVGLFESENVQKPYSRKDHGDMSIPGTLDAELDRVGVHLGRRGEKYVSSHDLDQTGLRFYPEARNEGFPPRLMEMTQKQREQLAQVLIEAEIRKKKHSVPSIFRWEVHYVISKGDFEDHRNRFVRMFVFLKELQRLYHLSDQAIQHLIKISANRYNPKTGLLTLQCAKYPNREDNRREIMRIVDELVKEGNRKFPSPKLHKPGSYITRKYSRSTPTSQDHFQADIKDFFDLVDADGDGLVSLEDWRVFFIKFGVKIEEGILQELKLIASEDSNGMLTMEDFTNILSSVCVPDIKPGRNSERKYKLKSDTMIFDFKTRNQEDISERQVA